MKDQKILEAKNADLLTIVVEPQCKALYISKNDTLGTLKELINKDFNFTFHKIELEVYTKFRLQAGTALDFMTLKALNFEDGDILEVSEVFKKKKKVRKPPAK